MTYAKLIPERRVELVTALRSGEYDQTQGELHNNEGFCCIGVACDLTDIGSWAPAPDNGYFRFMIGESINGAVAFMPAPVREHYFGMDYNDEVFLSIHYLMNMNDAQGKNFAEIADWIEENL